MIFLPPPLFPKMIFFTPSTVKISSFPLVFTTSPLNSCFFFMYHHVFSPNQPIIHIFAPPPGQNKKYAPLKKAKSHKNTIFKR